MEEILVIVGQRDMAATTTVASDQALLRLARCPRCGYDLRGTTGTWAEQCPLQGTCAECGLQFVWAEVLHPEKFEPQWCVEFAPGLWEALRACVRTFVRSFWPFGFWRALKMSMPIRWRRLVMYTAILCLPLLASYVTIQSVAAIRVRFDLQQSLQEQQRILPQAIAQIQRILATQQVDAQERQMWLMQIRATQVEMMIGYSMNHSYLTATTEAVLTPLRSRSSGTYTGQLGVMPYPAPSDLHSSLFEQRFSYLTSVATRSPAELTIGWLGLGVWLWLLLPPSFVFLPISRRRAKVRWGHIARASAYGFFIPVTAIVGSLLCISIGYALDAFFDPMLRFAHLLSRYFMPAMIVTWWATSMRHYLRMPHSWFVAVVLSGMLFLLYLAALWLLFPDFLLALW